MRYLAVIDQGTTNTKALLVDEQGKTVASASERVEISFPQPGWVESDASSIWQATERVLHACLDAAPARSVVAIGVSNQRESVTVWDRVTGEPLGPVVSWQCTRGSDWITRAARTVNGIADRAARTGLPFDPMFSASKAAWLLDRVPNGRTRAADGQLCVGTVDSWLLWNLSGGEAFATDQTNASRTMLMDLASRSWDAELCAAFGIPLAALPTIEPSAHRYAQVAVAHQALTNDATIAALAGDSHAALVGHRAFAPGAMKATFGTGTSVMAPTAGIPDVHRLAGTVAWSLDPDIAESTGLVATSFAVEANIVATGAALEWTANVLGFGFDVGRLEALATTVDSTHGVVFVPALSGLGAPHWDAAARGTVCGLTRGSGPAHIARAAFVAVAQQVADVLETIPQVSGSAAGELRVDGGAVGSNLLAQLVSDLTELPVVRSDNEQVAATGVAYLAGLRAGLWTTRDQLPHTSAHAEFTPTMSAERRGSERVLWADAVCRTLTAYPSLSNGSP